MTQPPTPYPPAAQPWSSPAAPAPRKPTGLIVLAIGLAAVLVGILGFAAGRLMAPVAAPVTTAGPSCIPSKVPSPTVASSTKRGFSLDCTTTLTGWTSTGSTITTVLPTGWKIGNYNGGSNYGQILNATGDSIDYNSGFEQAALDNCGDLILSIQSEEDIVYPPGYSWAGKKAFAAKIKVHSDARNMMIVLTYVCVDTTAGHSDVLRILASIQTNDAVMDAAKTVLNAWKWK
jgi:hypothetical protein